MKLFKNLTHTIAIIIIESCFYASLSSAFVIPAKTLTQQFVSKQQSAVSTSSLVVTRSQQENKRCVLTIQKMTDDDDDDEDYDDDDDENPLKDGINSVSWLPTVIGAKTEAEEITDDDDEDTEILPLFPLGGLVYTPNSEHVLNIFEPRYRQMYTDILMNGSKRFVVSMSHPTEKGRFAQTGVLFQLKDLKEVSEQTADQIKYICSHTVTGRVKLHKILNPNAWESRETYLKVKGTIIDDTKVNDNDDDDDESDNKKQQEEKDEVMKNDIYGAVAAALQGEGRKSKYTKDELELIDSFSNMVNIQHELEEDVRFTKASIETLAVKDGPNKDGLWQTIRLWQAYIEQRFKSRSDELQLDFQEKLQEYLMKEKGISKDELPSIIGFQDLSVELQKEVQELQKRMTSELEPMLLESTLSMQKILETSSHKERCQLIKYFIDLEYKRLNAKKTLQGMFSSSGSTSSSSTTTTSSSSTSSSPPKTTTTTTTNMYASTSKDDDTEKDEKKKAKKSTVEEEKSNDDADASSSSSSSSFFDDEDAFQ